MRTVNRPEPRGAAIAVLLALALMTPTLFAGVSPGSEAAAAPDADHPKRITREGVNVEFSVLPIRGGIGEVTAGEWADVTFRVTDASTGEAIKGRYPAAWMDLGASWEAMGERPMECRDRVAFYLQGMVGIRPMIDLNSHFLLVLNRDDSISVIDPVVGITGVTNLFGQINLSRPGADWVLNDDNKKLFVSMPIAGQVALVDTESFEVSHEIDAGDQPMRVELQRDQRFLWVGNNSVDAETSGVTVIDAQDLQQVAFIPTGPGHHEIAFSDGDRHAFVTNRDGGTVTVIDVQSLEKVADIETGPRPISVAYSALGGAIYVSDAETGTITVIDPDTREIRARIVAEPGLGPMRFNDEGRWGLVVNAGADKVFVIDASSDRLAHAISVGKNPYQVSFTYSFAYVRSLGTQDVGLIPMSELDGAETPPVTYIPAGQRPPGVAAEISIADSIIPAVKHAAAAYIVNQAEGTISYYMEGMGAPMGSFRNYGHDARAIEIVDRSLIEVAPGVYRGRVKLPVEGSYDVAFMMDSPQFLHCFAATVLPDETAVATAASGMAVEYQVTDRRMTVGEEKTIQFRLFNQANGAPENEVADVTVLYYRSDGRGRKVLPARPLSDGMYEATVKADIPATYYVFVSAPSKGLDYTDLPFFSLMAVPPPKGTKQ
jgi:YVTN family beta-propeller protein